MQSAPFIGVDVSKAELVIADSATAGQVTRIPNQKRRTKQWLRTLPAGTRIGVESTGRYHELVVNLAHELGFTVYLLNPRDLHHYGKAVHNGRKTDPLDAELIARYLAHEHARLRPYSPPTAYEQNLLLLQRQRAQVVQKKAALTQSLADLDAACQAALTEALASLQRLADSLDARIQALIAQDGERQALNQHLRTIPGVGPLCGAHLAALLPCVRPDNADALVGYVGLDPKPRDSGCRKGQRKLSKQGPAETRRLLYLAAKTAARVSPEWRQRYQDLLAQGRAPAEAINILARRLLRIAYALYCQGTGYVAPEQNQPLASAT